MYRTCHTYISATLHYCAEHNLWPCMQGSCPSANIFIFLRYTVPTRAYTCCWSSVWPKSSNLLQCLEELLPNPSRKHHDQAMQLITTYWTTLSPPASATNNLVLHGRAKLSNCNMVAEMLQSYASRSRRYWPSGDLPMEGTPCANQRPQRVCLSTTGEPYA